MREDDPENPYTLTGRQVVVLFAAILLGTVPFRSLLRSPMNGTMVGDAATTERLAEVQASLLGERVQ